MKSCVILATLLLVCWAQDGYYVEVDRYEQDGKQIPYIDKTLVVEFNYTNPGEYYKNETSPIYPTLKVEVIQDSANEITLRILNTLDTFSIPHEFPFPFTKDNDTSVPNYNYEINEDDDSFFRLTRLNGAPVFEITEVTMLSLLYSELHTALLSERVYGFGERRLNSFALPKGEFSLWNHDFWEFDTQKGYSLYAAHPVLLQQYQDKYHIVLLRSSRPMTLERTDDELIYRITGGQIEFKIFLGGSDVKSLIKQYHKYVNGWALHPFWSTGWHQSRWGYESSSKIKEVVQNYKNAQIPLEVIWTDLDYMEDRKDFTLNESSFPRRDIQSITNRSNDDGVHWVPIVDPGIAVESDCANDVIESGAYIKSNHYEGPYVGVVWPGDVYFIDFNHYQSNEVWYKCHADWFDNYQINPSGIWIDMNELANFRDGEKEKGIPKIDENKFDLQDLPWDAMGSMTLEGHTIAIDAYHEGNGLYFKGQSYITELDFHNWNGFFEQISERKALQRIQNKDLVFILSRASTIGSGRFSAIWFGDNGSTWAWLRSSVYQMFNFNFFGIPFVGDDICGFNGNTNPQLCARWIQLGAFYPFARDHNTLGADDQEPYIHEITKISAQNSIKLRYAFLKYYYQLFVQQWDNSIGAGSGTVVDPLWFKYGDDQQTFQIETQFQIGYIIVNPVTEEQTNPDLSYTDLNLYVPKNAQWISFENGQPLPNGWNKIRRTFTDNAFLALEAGSIIPYSNSTGVMRLRKMPSEIDLIVVLNKSGQASGQYMSLSNFDESPQNMPSKCWNNNSCIRTINVTTFKDTLLFTNTKSTIDFSEEITIRNIILYRNGYIQTITVNVSSFTQSWQINL